MTLLVLLIVAWGAFAFGAVYPWAYWPLFAAAGVIGVTGFAQRRKHDPGSNTLRTTAVALAILAACIAAQLVPLPQGLIKILSPSTDSLLRQHDIAYAGGYTTWHALSIEPPATRLGLLAFVSLALLAVGLAKALKSSRVIALVQGIAALGLIMAIAALIQRSTGTLKIYGFWTPVHHPYQIYGPFVNHNHFAGWMLMAIPLVLAAVIGELARTSASRRTWRSRILWIDSPEGWRTAFMVAAVLAMGVALVLTLSRSGITAFGITVLFLGVALMRERAAGRGAGVIAILILIILAASALTWSGIDSLANRFATGESITGRLPAWRGAIRIASAFPLVGSGLNTYETAMLYYHTRGPRDTYWDTAHNDYLQVASEGGLLLLVSIAICLWLASRQATAAWRSERHVGIEWIRVGAVAGMIGIGLQEMVDFSLQLPGNAALFAVLCAIAIHEPHRDSSSRRRRVVVVSEASNDA